MTEVEILVLGEPQPQGSKTVIQQRGRRPRMIEDNPLTVPWRQAVAAAALKAMAGAELLTGPLELAATFVFPRPKAHFGTGRNAGVLKASAPPYCSTRPDADKLLRAVGDALTGIVFRDDAQLVVVRAEKHYGDTPCLHARVRPVDIDGHPAMMRDQEAPAPLATAGGATPKGALSMQSKPNQSGTEAST